MQITNRQLIENIGQEYFSMPGVSFSSLKTRPIAPTPGMKLGTLVHQYLLEPAQYDHSHREIVIPIADKLRVMLPHFYLAKKEVTAFCTMEHGGFTLNFRGKIDLLIPNMAVVDLKIMDATDPMPSIMYFGYFDQLNGYMAAAGVPCGFIVAYMKKTREVKVVSVPSTHHFWEKTVLTHGKPNL